MALFIVKNGVGMGIWCGAKHVLGMLVWYVCGSETITDSSQGEGIGGSPGGMLAKNVRNGYRGYAERGMGVRGGFL